MEHLLQRAILLALVGLLCYHSGRVVGVWLSPEPMPPAVSLAAPPSSRSTAASSAPSAASVTARALRANPFSPPGQAAAGATTGSTEKPTPGLSGEDDAYELTSLPVKVFGTVAMGGGHGWALLGMNGEELLLRRGEPLPGTEATIAAVYRRTVVFERGGRLEAAMLTIAQEATSQLGGQTVQASSARPAGDSGQEFDASRLIKQLGPNRFHVEKKGLQEVLENLPALLQQMRVVPNQIDGQDKGFRISRVRAGSVFEGMGMRRDDVIMAINGRAIATPEDAFWLFRYLKDEPYIKLDMERGAQPLTLEYEIR